MNRLLVLALLVLAILSGPALAASGTDGSCASTQTTAGGLASRVFIASVGTVATNANGCQTTGQTLAQPQAGQAFVVRCLELLGSPNPPGAPDANGIRIRAYNDFESFLNGGTGTPVWEIQLSSCTSATDSTRYCTSDGTAAGAPRSGTLRLFVRAIRTTAVAYDVNSEDASANSRWGYLRCLAPPTTTNQTTILPASANVVDSTLPFFLVLGLGLAFIVATIYLHIPALSMFSMAASFAGYVLYRQAATEGVRVLGGPWIPVLLLVMGLVSVGAAAYAMKE